MFGNPSLFEYYFSVWRKCKFVKLNSVFNYLIKLNEESQPDDIATKNNNLRGLTIYIVTAETGFINNIQKNIIFSSNIFEQNETN